MFTEHHSILHREEPYHGLGRFGTFKKLIFSDVNLLKSEYRPLSISPILNEADFNAESIKKYFEIIEFSLNAYLEKGDSFPDIFYSALHTIPEIIKKNIANLERYSDKELRFSSPYSNLISCSTGTLSLIHFINTNAHKFPLPNKLVSENYNYFDNDRNIYGAITSGLYETIAALSTSNHTYESTRILLFEIYSDYNLTILEELILTYDKICSSIEAIAINSTTIPFTLSLLHDTLDALENLMPPLEAIQVRLNVLLENKIKQNLDRLLYPAITARLIYTFGLCEPEKANIPIHKILLNELKQKYLRTYDSNPTLALDMLPMDTEIDVSLKKLTRKHPLRWIRYKKIEELILT
jgi:hypothetical protein